MFKGSNVALVTPFKNNKLDEENYIKLINFHIENGTNGLVPAGTTGESPTLSHEEHDEDDWDQHPVSDRRVERELVHDSAVLERAWALLPPKVHTCSKLLLYSAPCANPSSPIPRLRAAKPQSPASGATHFW